MSKSGNLAALSAILSSSDPPTIYYAEDPPYLPRILIFYWPVHSVGSLASTSRIRTTILSAAGFKSFGAFSIAPSSAYYSAVHRLPDDKQRDDVSRGIAFALCRYFAEVPADVKNAITDENLKEGVGLKWGQTHAAQVTCRMTKVINTDEVVDGLKPFSKDRPPSPVTPVKPLASIRKTRPSFLPTDGAHGSSRFPQTSTPARRIPSGQRRTPSSSTPGAKRIPAAPGQKLTAERLESLRFKMCEFVDTEDRYISRLQELIELVTQQGRTPKSLSSKFSNSSKQKTVNAMIQFPSLLDQIRDLNLAFLDDVEATLQTTEESALAFLDAAGPAIEPSQLAKDPVGVYAFAKVLFNHFPKFLMPYRDYLDLHSLISSNLDQYLKDGNYSVQQAPSLLMEPAQRISRYGLYIDAMLPSIPPTSTMAIRTFEKARKIIAEICEMEPAASAILDSLRIEHEARRRAYSPTKLLSGLTRSNGSVREAPAITPNLKEQATPKLFHSLGRSLSRKNKSRPALAGILSEQDPEQAHNQRSSYRSDENSRPLTSGSGRSAGSFSRRPATASSSNTNKSFGMLESMPESPSPPTLAEKPMNQAQPQPQPQKQAVQAQGQGSQQSKAASIEHYKAALMRVEEENYKLLQDNAELKRQIRECRCGGAKS
jgi:RhoGEF domain